jgi:hypothetical protein
MRTFIRTGSVPCQRLTPWALVFLLITGLRPVLAASPSAPARVEKHSPESFDRVLSENALFFSLLVTFSTTAGISGPAWQVPIKNINVNLVTRLVHDSRGKQLVRVRVAGVVRKNNNVELDLLDPEGTLVGKSFFGYDSGQLTFFDPNQRAIVDGSLDRRGNFVLDDLRLPAGKRRVASGYVDLCFGCSYLNYGWWDAAGSAVGGGRVYRSLWVTEDSATARLNWTFERGRLGVQGAFGEAEYDFSGNVTGSINSVLFDTDRTAASFFAHPSSLVPQPRGRGVIPRFTDETGVAVTNPSARGIDVTYVARRFDGSLVEGRGIENPVTYRFDPGQQYAAFPGETFAARAGVEVRPFLDAGEVGWLEVFSDDSLIAVQFLEAASGGSALDGNIGAEPGGATLVFPDLRITAGESTEIELLNLGYDDAMVRLELLDAETRVLATVNEFFVAGQGMRSFFLDSTSSFLRAADPSRAASLRVSCNNSNSLRATGCSQLVGLATFTDSFGSRATSYAASADAAAGALVGAFFASGRSGGGVWRTTVRAVKLDGSTSSIYLDVYEPGGTLVETRRAVVPPRGHAAFVLESESRLVTGWIRLRSDSGAVAGDVSLVWSDGAASQSSTYPLAKTASDSLYFNQVAEGASGDTRYWTGVALVNDSDERADATLEVFRPDGAIDRTVHLSLEPNASRAALLSQLLEDRSYTRVGGYLRLTVSRPVAAIVLYGDEESRFLAAVPGVPR